MFISISSSYLHSMQKNIRQKQSKDRFKKKARRKCPKINASSVKLFKPAKVGIISQYLFLM